MLVTAPATPGCCAECCYPAATCHDGQFQHRQDLGEINRTLKDYLPPHRFVVIIAAVDN
jgi:hypothetical protein